MPSHRHHRKKFSPTPTIPLATVMEETEEEEKEEKTYDRHAFGGIRASGRVRALFMLMTVSFLCSATILNNSNSSKGPASALFTSRLLEYNTLQDYVNEEAGSTSNRETRERRLLDPFPTLASLSESSSSFDKLVRFGTSIALERPATKSKHTNKPQQTLHKEPRPLLTKDNLTEWKPHMTDGGLNDTDRITLFKVYHDADSVFEWGLGESTKIANYVKVPRYSGIDSDAHYVASLRRSVSSHFRFYFADTGETGKWGVPEKPDMPKNVWNYQMAPLMSELLPFDVYMVDGRYRVACVLMAFLHASSRIDLLTGRGSNDGDDDDDDAIPTATKTGAASRNPKHDTIVMLHDCHRFMYQMLFEPHRNTKAGTPMFVWTRPEGGDLCILRRHPQATDADIEELWQDHFGARDYSW